MRWKRCLIFLIQIPIILTKNIQDTSQSKECCPCPKDGEFTTVNEPSPNPDPKDTNDCICSPRLGDSEPSASADSVRHFKSVLREPHSNDDNKPLLHPEVDLASSVLQTLHQATDEEYREALERDAARSFVEEAMSKAERVIEQPTNLVTIVLNNPDTYDMDDTAGEESHVHEDRCTPFNLGDKLSFSKPKPNVLENFIQPSKINQDIFDQGLPANNIRSNAMPDKPLENRPNLFPKFKIPDLRLSPIINRFSEAENGRNVVMNQGRVKTKSVFGELKTALPNKVDSEIGASNVNEVMKNTQLHCDEPLLNSNSKQMLRNNEDTSKKLTLDRLTKLHQSHMEDLTTKIRNGNEKIANLLKTPKRKVDIKIEPMKIDTRTNSENNELTKDFESEPSTQYEIINTLDKQMPRTSLTNSINNRKVDFRTMNRQTKQMDKQIENKNTLSHNDENCIPTQRIKSDKIVNNKPINDEDLETMSNMLLEKSMKLESKKMERNNAIEREDNNSPKACSHELLDKNLKLDTNDGANERIIKIVPNTQISGLSTNKLRNTFDNLQSKLKVQPDFPSNRISSFKIDNPLKLEVPSLDDLKGKIEDSSLFNIKNPLHLELSSVDDIRDKLDDRASSFINSQLPIIDGIKYRPEESPINLGLPHPDEIKEKIEDFISNSNINIPSLDPGQVISSSTEPRMKLQFPPLKLPKLNNGNDAFNLELFRLNPVFSPLGNERGLLNTGLNLNSFRTSIPELKGLALKPLKLESFRKSNGNIIGASLSLNDIDSHFRKIKSDILESPTLKQIKEFTNNPKVITPNIVLPRNFDSIERKSSNGLKNTNFNQFGARPKPLQATIKVPILKPLTQQSQTTPNTSEFRAVQNNRNTETHKSMDPVIKAAIVNTLKNSRIPEPTTTRKPVVAKIIRPDKTLHTNTLKKPIVKPFQGILDNKNGLKSLHDLINDHKSITLKDIGSLRKVSSDSNKGLLQDPLNIFSSKDVANVKPKRLRQRINKSSKKVNMEENIAPKVETVKLSPKHNTLKLDSSHIIPEKSTITDNIRVKPIKSVAGLKINQLHLNQENGDTIFKKLGKDGLLAAPREPLSQSVKDNQIGKLIERKVPELKLPYLLLPKASNNGISSIKSWPSKSLLGLSDLRGSADTSRPVVTCTDDNYVGSSIKIDVTEKPLNLNTISREENNIREIEINEDENDLTCKEENLNAASEKKVLTENSQRKLASPVFDKLRVDSTPTFDELNSRVTDNGVHCETPIGNDNQVEPANIITTIIKPVVSEEDKLIEGCEKELPKSVEIEDKIQVADKSIEAKENAPCPSSEIIETDDGIQSRDESFELDNNSEALIDSGLMDSQVKTIDSESETLYNENDIDETVENIFDEDANETTNEVNNVNNEQETDSVVEPTNIESVVEKNGFEPITELNVFEDTVAKNNNDSEEKSVNNCDVLNNEDNINLPSVKSTDEIESNLSSNEEVGESSSEGIAETTENELNNKNGAADLLDKVRDHLHTSLKSLVSNTDTREPLLPFVDNSRDSSNIETNSNIPEDSTPFGDRIQTDTLPLNEGFNNLLERIKSSLQFMNKNDKTKDRSEAKECADSNDSTFEASNNVPAIEEIKQNESKSAKNIEALNDCSLVAEKSIDLPSALCGKGIPNEGDVSYKCRLVCTKE